MQLLNKLVTYSRNEKDNPEFSTNEKNAKDRLILKFMEENFTKYSLIFDIFFAYYNQGLSQEDYDLKEFKTEEEVDYLR